MCNCFVAQVSQKAWHQLWDVGWYVLKGGWCISLRRYSSCSSWVSELWSHRLSHGQSWCCTIFCDPYEDECVNSVSVITLTASSYANKYFCCLNEPNDYVQCEIFHDNYPGFLSRLRVGSWTVCFSGKVTNKSAVPQSNLLNLCFHRVAAQMQKNSGDGCPCETPCNLTRYGKELSMVKIPSKGSARYLSRKYDKSEDYIRYRDRELSTRLNSLMSSDVVLSNRAINHDLQSLTWRQAAINISRNLFYFHVSINLK